jgi:hypothetical protein
MNSHAMLSMFCGFCKNKGKDFKSHDLKNKDGIVICKEILSTECSYCHKLGHTKNHCDILQEKIKNKKEKDEEFYNKSFPPMVSTKDKKQHLNSEIKNNYKNVSIIYRDQLVLDEIIIALEKFNIENERIKKNQDKENEKKQIIQDGENERKNMLFQYRNQLRLQKKKDQEELFVSDMSKTLGCNWFLFIKKHFVMEDLVKNYNLLSVEDLIDIHGNYECEFEERMNKQEWEEERQKDIWDKENEIQGKKDDEFEEYQRANLSDRDFRDWKIDKMIQIDEDFENECGFCGTNSSYYMQSAPKIYVSNYIKTGQQLDPSNKELERREMKRV